VAERIHADDPTVPVLASVQDSDRPITGLRDDRPFADPGPPVYFYSRDRAANTPSGIWPGSLG